MVVSGSPKRWYCRWHITPRKAIYKWCISGTPYILPIGGLYATYHLSQEPQKSIEPCTISMYIFVILICCLCRFFGEAMMRGEDNAPQKTQAFARPRSVSSTWANGCWSMQGISRKRRGCVWLVRKRDDGTRRFWCLLLVEEILHQLRLVVYPTI